jgi:hypothetical protein
MGSGPRQLDIPINILPVGSSQNMHPCHRFIEDNGEKTATQALAIVATRERTTPDDIQCVCWALLRIPKEGQPVQVAKEAATLTPAQQELFWAQLEMVSRPLRAADPDPTIEEPPF